MISIKYSQIPSFLHDSSFYEALSCEEEDGEIDVPEQCNTQHATITSIDDFKKLVQVTAFWGLNTLPATFIEYCIQSSPLALSKVISNEEYAAVGFAQDLREIFVPKTIGERHDPLVNAIVIGRLDVVCILSARAVGGTEAATAAAESGRLDCLKLLHQHGYPWDETACEQAAAAGRLNCLQYLHENGCPWNNTVVLQSVLNNHFDCVQYAREQGLDWHKDTMTIAEKGHLEMLKYVVDRGCVCEERATYFAARAGHIECLKYLLSVYCPVNSRALLAILENGHLTCLQVLIDDDYFPFNVSWPQKAAYRGRFHMVRYLHERGCPWDLRTADAAAFMGHFDILFYAIENGSGYDYSDLAFSATHTVSETGLQCLKYLIDQRGFYVNGHFLLEAFVNGNYLAVEYLFTEGPYIMINDHKLWKIWSRRMRLLSDNDTYDFNLYKCFACALEHAWDVRTQAPKIVEIIGENCDRLPTCVALLNQLPEKYSWGWNIFCFLNR